MHLKKFTHWYVMVALLFTGMASSCQKDAAESSFDAKKTALHADSAIAVTSPANYLAVAGTLTLKIQDSTYTFNAADDSVAFVNMHVDDDRFFGITAINKAHTMSFGLSSKGVPGADITGGIEGSQLLLRPDAMHSRQYTLTPFSEPGDAGSIKLTAYRQDTVLAKGTFFTFLAKDDKADSPVYRVDGTFDLKIKNQP